MAADSSASYGTISVDINAEIRNLDGGSHKISVKRSAKFELCLLSPTVTKTGGNILERADCRSGRFWSKYHTASHMPINRKKYTKLMHACF